MIDENINGDSNEYGEKDIFSDDIDFLTFLMEEENSKEKLKAFNVSSPVFKTLIESRQEYNKLIKDSSLNKEDIENLIYGYDVYVVVDGYHYSIGVYPTIKEARKVERIIRMRFERDLKNLLKRTMENFNNGKSDRPIF